MALTKYKQKRNFKQTPEPSGKVGKAAAKSGSSKSSRTPVFVIQKHLASRLHYDFRIEHKGVMLSWAVPKGPSLNPDDKRLAMMVEDHPMEYNKFEGTIPEGNYGAGSVMIWDNGNYLALGAHDFSESEKLVSAGLAKGHITFVINGQKIKGEFALVKMHGGNKYGKSSENAWLLVKADDEYARKDDITKKDHSVVSGRSMEQITAGKGGAKTWGSNKSKSEQNEKKSKTPKSHRKRA